MDAEGSRDRASGETAASGPPPAPKEVRSERARGLSGGRLGQYEILSELGRGGMGVVYKARDRTLDRTVAVKVLPGHLASDPDFTKRFIREARAAARLDHPGIVQVYQAGKAADVLFIAMQYVEALPLSKIIEDEGPRSQRFALSVTKQVAEALALAHEHGIVHRDIKPSNIMVDEKGRVKVMDFGLAKEIGSRTKITRTGTYIGTPEYSSPEQCETQDLDGRSDIYSLGVVLYELLAGRVPFEAETPLKLFERICYEEPEPITKVAPNVGRELADLVERMMAKDREDRYADCAELVGDIERVERGESPKAGKRRRLRPVRRRGPAGLDHRTSGRRGPLVRRLAWGAAAALVVLALGVYFGSSWGRRVKDPAFSAADGAPDGSPDGAPDGARAVPREHRRRTAVVRDFVNSTGKKDLDWLRVGIADMLITDLAGCDYLDVMSRERARALTSIRAPRRAADIELNGSFAEAGGRIMVMAQLVDAEGGTVLRAVRAEGTEAEIFRIIDEVSSQVRSGLEKLLAGRLGEPVRFTRAEGGVASRLFLAMADPGEGGRTVVTDGETDKTRRAGERILGATGSGGGQGAVARKRALRAAPPGRIKATDRDFALAARRPIRQAQSAARLSSPKSAPSPVEGRRPLPELPEPPEPAADESAAVEVKAVLKEGNSLNKAEVTFGGAEAKKQVAREKSVRAKLAALKAEGRAFAAPESIRMPARAGAADGRPSAAADAALRNAYPAKAASPAKAGSSRRGTRPEAPPPADFLAEDLEEEAVAGRSLAEKAAAPEAKAPARPPRVAAIRARYRAMVILEAGSDRGSLVKALSLLEEARSLAPGLVGIGDEIARVRALLHDSKGQ